MKHYLLCLIWVQLWADLIDFLSQEGSLKKHASLSFLGFLAFLLDAYQEKERSDSSGNVKLSTVLHLHPQLAPVKVAVLSQIPQQNELCEVTLQLSSELREAGGCMSV